MQFRLTVDMDNEAFDTSPEIELASILRKLADGLDTYNLPDLAQTVRDYNGNTVGRWEVAR